MVVEEAVINVRESEVSKRVSKNSSRRQFELPFLNHRSDVLLKSASIRSPSATKSDEVVRRVEPNVGGCP